LLFELREGSLLMRVSRPTEWCFRRVGAGPFAMYGGGVFVFIPRGRLELFGFPHAGRSIFAYPKSVSITY